MIRLLQLRRRSEERGQSLVEFALILPILMLIVLGSLEFGFVFDHHLTLQYATREGARTGSALVNGGGALGCGAGQSPNAANVDPQIIAAVQRVLTSPGAPIDVADIGEIRIFNADANGNQIGGQANRWIYTPGLGPPVEGTPLNFSAQTNGWPACSRSNTGTPQSIGISLTYTYTYQTPLTAFLSFTTLVMGDKTVMQFNPTA